MTVHHIEYVGEYTKVHYMKNGVMISTFAPSEDVYIDSEGHIKVLGMTKRLIEL